MALKSSLPQPGLVKPEPVVWRGDTELPLSEQGVKVLGVPIGQPACVQLFLCEDRSEQDTLFQRIPWVRDPQAASLDVWFHLCQLLAAGSGS